MVPVRISLKNQIAGDVDQNEEECKRDGIDGGCCEREKWPTIV